MIIIFFTGTRLPKFVRLVQGQKCNKEYFITEMLEEINREWNYSAQCWIAKAMKIHVDNSQVYSVLETAEKI
jgi:hypothetical protein